MDDWNAEEFEAEISRKLEEEHKRRAEEKAAKEQAAASGEDEDFKLPLMPDGGGEETSATTESPAPAPEEETPALKDEIPAPEAETDVPAPPSDEEKPAKSKDTEKYSAELSAIMQEESDKQKKHSAFVEAQDEAFAPMEAKAAAAQKGLPPVVRAVLTVVLLICGGAGVYIMAVVQYPSMFINPLCFAETSVCLLGALGLNTSQMANRLFKSLVMKLGTLALFGFYCLYALKVLSMTSLLHGVGKVDWLAVAREGISFNVPADVAAMGKMGMAQIAVFVIPFAFFLLLLVRPLRNVGVYFCVMPLVLFAAGLLRFITKTGYASLAQCVICLIGAAAAYFLFMLPPLQHLMRRSGLIGWAKVIDDD